jgi:hypothetical protein
MAACCLLSGVLVVGCDSVIPSSATASPGSSGALDSGAATIGPPPSFGPPPSPTPPDSSSPITLDPTLLAFLPPAIDGIPVVEDLDVASEALLDPTLPNIATGANAAVAVDAGNGNLVTAWVVRLRDGAFGDEAFRQWRESYDEGACNAGGGVLGSAEAEIGGRNTFITSCVAAFRTYHVWLEEQNVLISATSIGEGRFGEKLMASLRVPE